MDVTVADVLQAEDQDHHQSQATSRVSPGLPLLHEVHLRAWTRLSSPSRALQHGTGLLCRLSRDRGELGPLFTLTDVQMGLPTCLHSPLRPFKKRISFGMTLDKKMSCLFVKQSTCLKGDL